MNVDVTPTRTSSRLRAAADDVNIMMEESHLRLRGSELEKYEKIKNRPFLLTSVVDPDFLRATGMDRELAIIFHTMGWENFYRIDEPGSKLLTAEFLCTLQLFSERVTFRLFNKEFDLTWKQLSEHLGFTSECVINVDSKIPEFDKHKFWKEISGEDVCDHVRTSSIQHPTL